MLAAEGDEVVDGRVIAALDVAAQELAALREAQGVDGGGCAEDRVRGELVTDEVYLLGYVAEEGCCAVAAACIAQSDDVHVCAGVGCFGEGSDSLDAFALEVVAQSVPDDQRELGGVIGGGCVPWDG